MGIFGTSFATAAGPAIAADPIQLYGNEIRFDVERDGDVVGQHVVTFTRTDQGVKVDARADIDISVLFIPAYRFKFQSHELWRDGALLSMDASTNDDGDYVVVKALRDDTGLRVKSTAGEYEAPTLLPMSHWNAALLKGGVILNTMTGELIDIKVQDVGFDTVTTRNGSLRARHYIYSGDLTGDIWYDSDGRWVRLRFEAHDGSTIDYVCRRCRTAPVITEAD
jgi:hypothetical protein